MSGEATAARGATADATRSAPPLEPLEPGRPTAGLGWLRGATDRVWPFPIPVWLYVVITVPLTLALGIWGFLELDLSPPYTVPEAVYRAIKLYTLDLGPAASGSKSPRPNIQLWLALVLAALLVLRGVVGLLRNHLQRTAMHYALRRHVVVVGAGVHGSRLVGALSGDHDVVLLDLDPGAPGMRGPLGKYEWRLVGDGVRRDTLLAAGVDRAHWVVAMTGDDFVNSQIVSAVRALAGDRRVRDGARVFVQVEDPSIARFLEEPEGERGQAGVIFVSPFSANAIAAEALIDSAPVERRGGAPCGYAAEPGSAGAAAPRQPDSVLLEMRDGRSPNLLLAGDHPLIDAIVLAALRRWRVRVLRDIEANATYRRPPMHVSVFGPGALERVEALRRRWQPEAHVLAIEARDAEPSGEASAELDEWLHASDRADHAIVVCNAELDGVGLALRVSRALGAGTLMTRVTTQLESVLDDRLKQSTLQSDRLATTDVKSIADLACEPEQMMRLAGRQQLLAALAPETARGANLPHAPRISREAAAALVTELYEREHELGIRSDSTWRILPCERAMLEALVAPVPLSALVRAGLRVDLATPGNLRFAALALSKRAADAGAAAAAAPEDEGVGRTAARCAHESISAWCEYARHVTAGTPDVLAELHEPTGDLVVDRLLALRRATLGERAALDGLQPDGALIAGVRRAAIFAGPAGSASDSHTATLLRLLKPALRAYDGAILSGGTSVGIPGVVALVARDNGLPLIGYTPPGRADRHLYERVRETPPELFSQLDPEPREFSIREPLTMWTDILRAGISAEQVSMVVFSGGLITTEELLLARALGARVAWLDPTDAESVPLADKLPLGDGGIVQLPSDPMTIRAFITSSELSGDERELREQVARYLHNDYRRKQRGRKAPGDPALAPWDELLETLKDSNRAAADDIPNKLALIGKQLVVGGAYLKLTDQEVELLAEAEHGRWNAERLAAGWELGERHVSRSASPDLKAWSELTDATKEWDREAVRNIPPALAEAGWGVEPK